MDLIDILLLLAYLLAVLGIGLFHARRRAAADDFFLAGRSMGMLPIGLSVMVTSFSAVNYISVPTEVAGNGLYIVAAFPVFALAAWPISRIWMPFFHAMRLTSVYAWLEERFDLRVRCLGSALFILWRVCWMATALYASGRILAGVADLPPVLVICGGGLLATVYTAIGGMRAVMWTDVAQFCVLFGGIACALVLAAGNPADLFARAHQAGSFAPFAPFDPTYLSTSPWVRMTLWSGLLGVFVAFLGRYGADQVIMQRYFTARDLRAAQRGLWLNAVAAMLALGLLALLGLAVVAHARNGGLAGPPMRQLAGLIASLPVGITGLIVAGLLAATMSSVDSGINACTAAYTVDYHGRLRGRRPSLGLERGLTCGLGLLATALALALIPLIGPRNTLFVVVNKLINGLGSPLLALFLLGMFTRRINAPGVFIGGLIGLIASIALTIRLTDLGLWNYATVNLLVTLLPAIICSWIATRCGHVQPTRCAANSWVAWRQQQREAD
ncbi:MAG: sodium:solute symporter family transporter [Planctomycetota bacterium]